MSISPETWGDFHNMNVLWNVNKIINIFSNIKKIFFFESLELAQKLVAWLNLVTYKIRSNINH